MEIFNAKKPAIAVFAPAGPITPEQLSDSFALWDAEDINYQVMPNTFVRSSPESYLSASVADRVADLQAAWNGQFDWLVPTRGGYGCAQLLSYLNYKLMSRFNPKVLGYSDLTALHLAMTAAGVGTPVSGPTAGRFAELLADEANLLSFKKAMDITSNQLSVNFAGKTYTPGAATGLPLVVNLTVCASMCGTPFMPKTDNRVVIVEDINEPPYRIDRALNQLMQSGVFDSVAAVIFGDFTNCGDTRELDIIFSRTAAFGEYPCCSGFPFGHEKRVTSLNWTKPVNISTSNGRSILTVI